MARPSAFPEPFGAVSPSVLPEPFGADRPSVLPGVVDPLDPCDPLNEEDLSAGAELFAAVVPFVRAEPSYAVESFADARPLAAVESFADARPLAVVESITDAAFDPLLATLTAGTPDTFAYAPALDPSSDKANTDAGTSRIPAKMQNTNIASILFLVLLILAMTIPCFSKCYAGSCFQNTRLFCFRIILFYKDRARTPHP